MEVLFSENLNQCFDSGQAQGFPPVTVHLSVTYLIRLQKRKSSRDSPVVTAKLMYVKLIPAFSLKSDA
jgi:hypothetical protein